MFIFLKAIDTEQAKGRLNADEFMLDVIESLTSLFSRAIRAACSDLGTQVPKAAITPATNPKFGDYQCNNAMALVQVRYV